jgi:hypothetical protein
MIKVGHAMYFSQNHRNLTIFLGQKIPQMFGICFQPLSHFGHLA